MSLPPSRKSLRFSSRKRRPTKAIAIGVVVAVLAVAGVVYFWDPGPNEPQGDPDKFNGVSLCKVPLEIRQRVWNGYVPERSGDVLAIEDFPNSFGTRHSSPWPYTQYVPLVLWGPGFIEKGYTSDEPVTLADIAPTYAELLRFDDWPQGDGQVLSDALRPTAKRGLPKLIFTVVWDGGGLNGLEQWPDDWPFLKSLMDGGARFTNASVGSTPSITPSTHATMGTGVFPKTNGISDIRIRVDGRIQDSWEGTDPSGAETNISPENLEVPTIGDLWDQANDNLPVVGMMGRDAWHIGMMGHGAYMEGGDKDIAVLDSLTSLDFRSNPDYYTLPDYVSDSGDLAEMTALAEDLDQADGEADSAWLGNPILPVDGKLRSTPAWNEFQTEKVKLIIENEQLGADDVPDLFYVNYKSTDLAGHEWNILEEEVQQNFRSQDQALEDIVTELNDVVGEKNYVLLLTGDHGMTPDPESTGGWSVDQSEVEKDINAHYDHLRNHIPLVLGNRGYQYFLNTEEMAANEVTAEDVAKFLKHYSIRNNANGDLGDFEDKADERVFLSAFTPDELAANLTCTEEPEPGPSG